MHIASYTYNFISKCVAICEGNQSFTCVASCVYTYVFNWLKFKPVRILEQVRTYGVRVK